MVKKFVTHKLPVASLGQIAETLTAMNRPPFQLWTTVQMKSRRLRWRRGVRTMHSLVSDGGEDVPDSSRGRQLDDFSVVTGVYLLVLCPITFELSLHCLRLVEAPLVVPGN